MNDHSGAHRAPDGDPVAKDIENRDPETGDAIAGEQVLDGDLRDERPVAPHQDDLRRDANRHRDEYRAEEAYTDGPRHRETRSADRVQAAVGDGGPTIASVDHVEDVAESHADPAQSDSARAAMSEQERDRAERHA